MRRRWGQHFLRDVAVAEFIAGQIPPGVDVLEVGPGRGALTLPLARRARLLYVIEVDRRLVEILRREMPPNVVVIEGDALKISWPKVDHFVSNMPYSITSPLLMRLVEYRLPAVVTVQKEVADRLAAEPGSPNYGRLTVAVRCHYDVETLRHLPPSVFTPPPKVWSTVIRLTPRTPCVEEFQEFQKFTAWLFSHRRKTLRRLKLADTERRVFQLTLEEIVWLYKTRR
ncbi:MAG: 16S rRNA (adenine(1518)-N(6)/adenine(1519)-N(6))-dimethyltransferase RsmA [Pyrobaculum sp.]